jgi:hypothetical protein
VAKVKARREQLELENQIKRATYIPREDAERACKLVSGAIAGIIEANRKLLGDESTDEILGLLRETLSKIKHMHGNGSVFVQDAD